MRADDDVDIVALQADAGERGDDIVAGRHDRRHQPGETAPARLGVVRQRRVAAGIEQHIALRMAQQRAAHRHVEGLAPIGIGEIEAFARAQAAAGEEMHFHYYGRVLGSFLGSLSATLNGVGAAANGGRAKANGPRRLHRHGPQGSDV